VTIGGKATDIAVDATAAARMISLLKLSTMGPGRGDRQCQRSRRSEGGVRQSLRGSELECDHCRIDAARRARAAASYQARTIVPPVGQRTLEPAVAHE
jgi:hypothetical protein